MLGTAGFHNTNDDRRQPYWVVPQSWGSSHEGSESNKQFGGDALGYGDGSNGDKRRKLTPAKRERFNNAPSWGSRHEGSESNTQLGGDARGYGDGCNVDKRRKLNPDKRERFNNVTSLGGSNLPLCL